MKRFWKNAGSLFSRDRKGKRTPSRAEAIFDRDFYLAANEDVRQSELNPWRHFATHGWKEGRKPHPQFDVGWYLDHNPDVAVEGINPFEHFVVHGWREGRQPVKGMVCDRLAVLDEEDDPAHFNPLDHLVSANGEYSDWSKRIREVAAGNLDEAIRLCTVWKQKGGKEEATPRLRLGELLASRGEFSEAAAEFEEALELDPGSVSPLVSLGEAALREGNRDLFQSAFERLEAAEPDLFRKPSPRPRIACLIGFQRLNEGRFLAALVGFDQLAKSNPTDDLPFLGRGLALLELGSREESFSDFWRSLRLNPLSKPARDELKQLWPDLFPGLPEEAFGNHDKGTAAGPESVLAEIDRRRHEGESSPEWHRLEAHSQLAGGDFESAIESLTAPDAGSTIRGREVHCLLARIHADSEDPGRAITELETAFQGDPNNNYLRFRTLELGDRRGPAPAFLGEVRPDDCFEIGDALLDAGCSRSAAFCFGRSAAESQDDGIRARSLEKLARCHLRNGQYDLAGETAHQVLESGTEGAEAHLVLGSVNRRMGNRKAAIEHFQTVLAASPHQEAWVYRDLAAELDRSGDRREAIETLQTGGEQHPDDTGLERDYQRLDRLDRLRSLSELIAKTQAAGRPADPGREEGFVSLLRWFIDADWPVIGRDFAECRVCMDEVIRKHENWPLHLAYGDLLVRCGNKFDGLGYYEEAHRTAASCQHYEEARPILRKIVAILEQLEIYDRCLSYLEQLIHGMPAGECRPELRRLACYSAMLGKRDKALGYWHALRNAGTS